MTIENIMEERGRFTAGDQVLVIESSEYEPTFASDSRIDINPNLKASATVYFDVPPSTFDLHSLTLELHDSSFSRGVKVRVFLNS